MVTKLLNFLIDTINIVLGWLPPSPFTGIVEAINGLEWLGWLNWFIPVGRIIQLTAAWIAAIALYYLASIALRWVKAIR